MSVKEESRFAGRAPRFWKKQGEQAPPDGPGGGRVRPAAVKPAESADLCRARPCPQGEFPETGRPPPLVEPPDLAYTRLQPCSLVHPAGAKTGRTYQSSWCRHTSWDTRAIACLRACVRA